MKIQLFSVLSLVSYALIFLASVPISQAGVFDLPQFVEAGQVSLGVEPEVYLSKGTGAGINLKPRIGATDFLNWQFMIGTGSGSRTFRVGGAAHIEWFPDYEGQLGFATPLYSEYYRYKNSGQWINGIKPMIYKTFKGQEASYTPFISVPLGWSLYESDFSFFTQFAVGCLFKIPGADHWRFITEAGFDLDDSYTYISGGVSYFF